MQDTFVENSMRAKLTLHSLDSGSGKFLCANKCVNEYLKHTRNLIGHKLSNASLVLVSIAFHCHHFVKKTL